MVEHLSAAILVRTQTDVPAKLSSRSPGTGQKAGGQALIGGIDCMVSRNFFGAQVP